MTHVPDARNDEPGSARGVQQVTGTVVLSLRLLDSSPLVHPQNCWGVVTSQLAGLGGLGEHASQQEVPRVGLGNLARSLGFDHISEMGTFLAEIDGIEATECG